VLLVSQGRLQCFDGRLMTNVAGTERLSDRRSDQRRIADGCKVDEGSPVRKLVREIGCHLQREADLADAARSGLPGIGANGVGSSAERLGSSDLAKAIRPIAQGIHRCRAELSYRGCRPGLPGFSV